MRHFFLQKKVDGAFHCDIFLKAQATFFWLQPKGLAKKRAYIYPMDFKTFSKIPPKKKYSKALVNDNMRRWFAELVARHGSVARNAEDNVSDDIEGSSTGRRNTDGHGYHGEEYKSIAASASNAFDDTPFSKSVFCSEYVALIFKKIGMLPPSFVAK